MAVNPAQPTNSPFVEVQKPNLPGGPSGSSFVLPTVLTSAVRALDANGMPYKSCATGLTALASGGQTGATLCSKAINVFDTVANAGDSAILPSTQAGTKFAEAIAMGLAAEIIVVNHTTTSMNLFPATGEQINNLTANTQIAVAANKSILLINDAIGQWEAILSA